ncbi:MAG TPA: tetratricopeptide repeat protein [Candidatus Eisenbacteria bacterium]|nr:tetratricopeptide repeat protein [Candidatus Eisenbacteria bacterium]
MTRARSLRWISGAALAALLVGCGDAREQSLLYRCEMIYYKARKADEALRLGGARPDTIALAALRNQYLGVRKIAPGPYTVEGDSARRERAAGILRVVGLAETQAARIALEMRRPDLTLASAGWLKEQAGADSSATRQAAFMTVAALQGLRRFEDAVKEMKEILERYPPQATTSVDDEDPILGLPQAIVDLRANLADEAGAARERREAQAYFQRLLERRQPPLLEVQIRMRLLRTLLDLEQPGRALEQTNALETLIAATPQLKPHLAEIQFAKGKILTVLQRDPSDGIEILERVATDFPKSPIAPRAIYEAGLAYESSGRFKEALAHYEMVIERFPDAPDVAPLCMYRTALVQDRLGDWGRSKRTLEAIPIRYPRSQAAAEAPTAVIQHYLRENQKTAAKMYLPRAYEQYRSLATRDSTGRFAMLYRLKMFQVASMREDSTAMYAVAEDMLRRDPRHPYTAQILIGAARAAAEGGNPNRSARYWRRFLQEFPYSPLADGAKRELKRLEG